MRHSTFGNSCVALVSLGIALAFVLLAGCGEDEEIVLGKASTERIHLGLWGNTFTDAVFGYQITDLPRDTWEVTAASSLDLGPEGFNEVKERLKLRRPAENVRITVEVEPFTNFSALSAKAYVDGLARDNELAGSPATDRQTLRAADGSSYEMVAFGGWFVLCLAVRDRRAYRLILTADYEDKNQIVEKRTQFRPEHIEALQALVRHFKFL